MPTSKTLPSPPKNNANVLWSISLCQTRQDVLEVAKCLVNCPQIVNVTLNIPDQLERFNILADILLELQQGKKMANMSEGVFKEISKLIANATSQWNDDEIDSALNRIANSEDIRRLFLSKAENWLKDNQEAMQLLQQAGKGGQIIRWQEFTNVENFQRVFNEVAKGVRETASLQRGISGEVTNRVRKYYSVSTGVSRRLIESLCRLYLQEEATWRIFAGQRTEYEYEIYYGTLTHVVLDIYRKYGGNSNAMKSLPIIDMRPIPQIKEQRSLESTSAFSTAINFPFFKCDVPSETFPYQMSFRTRNHAWKAECEVQFIESSKDVAIKTLFAEIAAAKDDYSKKKDHYTHPIVLEYKRQFMGYLVSYRIEINDSEVLIKANPFDLLINTVKVQSVEQWEELSERASTPTAGYSDQK